MSIEIDTIKTEEPRPVVYAPVIKQKLIKDSAIVDWFMTALIVLITISVIATYFIVFDVDANFNLKQATLNTAWFAIGNFAIGSLGKKIFRRKCEKTQVYIDAEKEANDEINTLCENDGRRIAPPYCRDYTRQSIRRYREHQLAIVGISLKTFNKKYLGKSFKYLRQERKKGVLSFAQVRAIIRCNHIKMKAYNPNFILSYNSSTNELLAPSEMYNSKKTNAIDNVKSAIMGLLSAVGIGFMFSDVILNFSLIVLFEAIVKTIMLAINLGLKCAFGWNLGVMDIQRNKLRASEAKACKAWADGNPDLLLEEDEDDEETVEENAGALVGAVATA